MGYAGKINPHLTHIEKDEQGKIWLIQNYEFESVLVEMEDSATGNFVVEDFEDLYDDEILFGDDYY